MLHSLQLIDKTPAEFQQKGSWLREKIEALSRQLYLFPGKEVL